MLSFLKKYYIELSIFAVYSGILFYISPLDITQVNSGDKTFSFLYSAVYFERLHPSPLYTYLGWLVTRLPMSDGMSLSIFLSIIPSIATCIFVYLIIKKLNSSIFYARVGTLLFAASWIFVAQAVRIESYLLVTLLLVVGYYFYVCRKSTLSMLFLGLAMGSHWGTSAPFLFGIFFFDIFNKEFFLIRKWYIFVFTVAVIELVWYFVVPTYNVDIDNSINLLWSLQIGWGAGNLIDIVDNMPRFLSAVVFSIGLGLMPAVLFFIKDLKKSVIYLFPALIPLFYSLITIADCAVNQAAMAVPFLAIAGGLGMKYIDTVAIRKMIIIGSIVMMLSSIFVWNIDTNPTTARDMINQLDNVPDHSIIVDLRLVNGKTDTYGGGVDWTVNYYNKKMNKNLFPLNIGYLGYAGFNDGRQKILDQGIIIPNIDDMTGATPQKNMENVMNSLCRYNPEKDFYYYDCVDLISVKYELKKWTIMQ